MLWFKYNSIHLVLTVCTAGHRKHGHQTIHRLLTMCAGIAAKKLLLDWEVAVKRIPGLAVHGNCVSSAEVPQSGMRQE
jgi:hypothetical protein